MFSAWKRILECIPEDKSELKKYRYIVFIVFMVTLGNLVYFHQTYVSHRKMAATSTGSALGITRVHSDIEELDGVDRKMFLMEYRVLFKNVVDSLYGTVIPEGVIDVYIPTNIEAMSYLRLVNHNGTFVLDETPFDKQYATYSDKNGYVVISYPWSQYFIFVLSRAIPLSFIVGVGCTMFILKDLSASKKENEIFQLERFSDIAGVSSGVAHNMRNYLSVIKLNAQLIQHTLKSAKLPQKLMGQFEKQIVMVLKNIQLATTMTSDLLDFAKQTTEMPDIEEVELLSLIGLVVDMFEESLEIDSNILLHYVKPEEYKEIYCNGNERLIINVLMNLLKNASESFQDIDVTSKNIAVDLNVTNTILSIVIIDNGCGMSKETLKRIKEPFFTVDKVGGTGLGIPGSDRIIRNMGGTLEYHSTKGKGTTTMVRIPINSIER